MRSIPDFAADLVLETWESDNETDPLLTMRYEGEQIFVPGCEKYGRHCPLSVVRRAIAEYIPKDINAECNAVDRDMLVSSPGPKTGEPSDGTSFAA